MSFLNVFQDVTVAPFVLILLIIQGIFIKILQLQSRGMVFSGSYGAHAVSLLTNEHFSLLGDCRTVSHIDLL